ncbi:MAG: hypothetical protein WBV22_11920 [Anaerolineaceae bacterium]
MQIVQAQEIPVSTGTLVVSIHTPLGEPLKNIELSYSQLSHDFLYGYSGPLPAGRFPEAPYGLSLELQCIPWVEIEPRAGVFPHQAEEDAPKSPVLPTVAVGNDCLLYFGEDALNDLPSDLSELSFDDLLARAQSYLEHAIRYQSAKGVSLFVIKEPGYPTANLLGFSAGQWLRLVKLSCQVIRQIDPQATIVFEVVPQYLPSRGYTPYTFLDTLIRDGVTFDAIMLVFSPPITAKFTSAGYPSVEWVDTQMDVFTDLGKQLIIRFSGVTIIKDEDSRQAWLEDSYSVLFKKQTVIGIYWDEVNRYPVKLTSVSWPVVKSEATPSSRSVATILEFIRARTCLGKVVTDSNGQVVINAYAGIYDIQVEGILGNTHSHIYRGEERRLELVFPDQEATRLIGQNGSLGQTDSKKDNQIPETLIIGLISVVTLTLGSGLYYWYKRRSKKD